MSTSLFLLLRVTVLDGVNVATEAWKTVSSHCCLCNAT